jgi:hypothetical protein
MRNVLFHLTPTAAAHLINLSGEILPTGKNEMPVFDDKTSFEFHVTNGTVSMSTDALADIMNSYVFAKPGAPLKDLKVAIKDGLLNIKGKLAKGDVPFETSGSLSVDPDGRLRIHTEKVKAMKIPMKKVMSAFGVDLAKVVNTDKVDGLDTDKNDLLMDLGTLLPPPHIRGKITAVKIQGDNIVTTFGNGSAGGIDPSLLPKEKNFMYFRGGKVHFGKLIMNDADLAILDLDPTGPIDWNQDRYKDQLTAGYGKITPAFGLQAYIKDYAKLPKSKSAQ